MKIFGVLMIVFVFWMGYLLVTDSAPRKTVDQAKFVAPVAKDGLLRKADDIEQALLQARSWTERQVAPSFPDFEKRFKLAGLCNDLDSGTCVWRDSVGGLHLNLGFTLMDAQG